MVEAFRAALAAASSDLPGPELLPSRLARACAEVLPVDGAGISLFFVSGRRLPVGASDEVSGVAERLQFTVGEGPCLAAVASAQAVVADEAALEQQWPAYHADLVRQTAIRGVVALPLQGALRGFGALDLYLVPPNDVHGLALADVLVVTHEITRVFQDAVAAERDGSGSGPAWLDAPQAERRSLVWQAMGLLNAALHIDSPDALALLRAHAFAVETDVDSLAQALIDGSVETADLAPDADPA